MRNAPAFAFALLAGWTVPHGALAGPAELAGLKPHRAVYEVTLDEASERSGITGIKGRMVYESRGSACDGYSIKFRFFQNVRTQKREYTSDQRTTSFESADGTRFDFVNRAFFNGSLEKEVKGSARKADAGIAVELEKPTEKDADLAAATFPTAHLADVIAAAKAGRRILAADVFEGSDDGDKVLASTSIVGKPLEAGTATNADLKGVAAWPVSIAYFSGDADSSGERLPVYQVSFRLYENGVSESLSMRYDDYALKAELTDLEYLPVPECKTE